MSRRRPLVVQLVPPENLAAGAVPWGLAPYVPAESYREISTATPDSCTSLMIREERRSSKS